MNGKVVKVTLSERNLKTLLAKLQGHPPNSTCTLRYDNDNGEYLIVTAERDDIHYAHPDRAIHFAGPIHPDTLAFIKREENS